MSKLSKQKARARKGRYAKPSAPRAIGANDNIAVANDNMAPVTIRGVTLTDNQAIRFVDATTKIANRDLDIQRAGHRILEALDGEIDQLLASREVTARFREMSDLEFVRDAILVDVTIKAPDGTTAKTKRVERDGLETLLTAGSLTRTQHAAGLRYRADYEAIDPERQLTPPILDPEKVKSAHGGDNWDAKRREIERRVYGVHLMICGVDVEPGERAAMPNLPAGHPARRAIHALNEIAGKGMNIRDMASGGRTRARIRDDLEFALDACAITYGLE